MREHETNTKMELSHGQSNATEKESKSKSLIDVERIEGTPFVIVTKPDEDEVKNSFIGIGDNRLTEMMSYGKAMMMINERNWDLIVQAIVYISSKVKEDKDI